MQNQAMLAHVPLTQVAAERIDSSANQHGQTPSESSSAISKPLNPHEKAATQVQAKKPIPKRTIKTPNYVASNGTYGNLGLGKLSYFLDQMKSEVSDADRMIKHLQTDMKVLVSPAK